MGKFVQAGINAETAVEKVFKGSDRTKLILEKNKSVVVSVNGKEITVNYKPAAKIRTLFKNLGSELYDAYTSLDYVLSPEEVNERAEAKNPKYYNTDAFMFATNELDTEKLTPLSEEGIFDRFVCFAEICNRVAAEEILEMIAYEAEKKKDGLLYKGRVLPIAAFAGVTGLCNIFELTGKAVSNTEIEVNIQQRTFNKLEYKAAFKNSIVKAIEEGKVSTKSKPETKNAKKPAKSEYITIVCNLHNANGLSAKLPAVKLEDGRLALDVEPKIALSDFECLIGSDKNGYELVAYKPFEESSVVFQGESLPISCGVDDWSVGLEWRRIAEYAKLVLYSKKNKEKILEEVMSIFRAAPEKEDLYRDKFMNEQAVLEHFYQLFYTVDAVSRYYKDLNLQDIADNAPLYEDTGKLVRRRWLMIALDTKKQKAVNMMAECKAEDVLTFADSFDYEYRTKPIYIPFVMWEGSLKKGFQAAKIEVLRKDNWEN